MESGFRAAKAWVEVTTDLDGSQIERAARRVAGQVDDTLTEGMDRAGENMSRSLGRSGERAGDNLIKTVHGKVKRDGDSMFRPALDGATRSGLSVGQLFGGSMIKAAVPVVTALAPTVGAAIGGGILASGSLGVIGAGIALAVQDERVKEAASATGKDIGSTLKGAAEPFRDELLNTFAQGRSAFARWAPELRGLFADAAPLMRPLTSGIEEMVDELLPGLRKGVKNSEPVVNSLRLTFARLGDATGDMFSDLADDAQGGALAINDVSLAVENLIRTTTKVAEGAAKLKELTNSLDVWIDRGRYWIEDNSYLAESLRDVGIELDLTADGFKKGTPEAEAARRASLGVASAMDFATLKAAGYTDAQITAADASGTYRGALKDTVDNLLKVRGSANGAIEGVRSLGEIMADYSNKTLAAEDATMRMEQAIDDATASVKENGKGIDANNPKQRENRRALLEIAASAKEAAAKVREQTGSEEKAAAVTARARSAFLATAKAMGVKRSEAVRLADSLFGIPNVKREVTVRNAAALAALKAVKSGIASVRDKTVVVTVKYETRGSAQGEHIIGSGTKLKGLSTGGPVEDAPGPRGVDSRAYLLARGEHVWTADEVDAYGGHAAMERMRAAARGGRPFVGSAVSAPGPSSGGDQYHFGPGSIVLDASKIKDVADLARLVANLTPAARSMVRRGASVGSRA